MWLFSMYLENISLKHTVGLQKHLLQTIPCVDLPDILSKNIID